MAYSTPDEFRAFYPDTSMSDSTIERYLNRATAQIDYFTQDRITRTTIGELSLFQQVRIKNATIESALFIAIDEGITSQGGNGPQTMPNGMTSFKLGDLEIAATQLGVFTQDKKSNNVVVNTIGSIAYMELERTGLLYNGVGDGHSIPDISRRID